MGIGSQTVNVGLLGFGVVGQGVWKNIEKNRSALEQRLGVSLRITRIVVRDLERERTVAVPEVLLSEDPAVLLNDPDIDIVCELIGGIDKALSYTEAALKQGKIVVTANKALVCEHGAALFLWRASMGGITYTRHRWLEGFLLLKQCVKP